MHLTAYQLFKPIKSVSPVRQLILSVMLTHRPAVQRTQLVSFRRHVSGYESRFC